MELAVTKACPMCPMTMATALLPMASNPSLTSTGRLMRTYSRFRSAQDMTTSRKRKLTRLSAKKKYPQTSPNSTMRAIIVPSAAPAISMRGAPSLPKMNTQLQNTFTANAAMDASRGSRTCPTLRSTMVQVWDRPMQKNVGSIHSRYIFP